jgi:hypothetical protein
MIGWPFSFSLVCRALVGARNFWLWYHSDEYGNLTNSDSRYSTAPTGFWYINHRGCADANIAQAA